MGFKTKKSSSGDKRVKNWLSTTYHTSGNKNTSATRSSSQKRGSGNAPRVTTTQKATRRKDGSIKYSTVVTETRKDVSGYTHRKSNTISTSGSSYSKPKKSKALKILKSKSPKVSKVKPYDSTVKTSTRRRKSSGGGFGALLSALFTSTPKKTKKATVKQTPVYNTQSELSVLKQRYNELSQQLIVRQTSEDINFLYDLTFTTPHNDNIDLLKAQIAKMERHLGKIPEVVVNTTDNVVLLFNKEETEEVKIEPGKKPSVVVGLLLWAGIIYGLWSLISYIF